MSVPDAKRLNELESEIVKEALRKKW